MAGVGPAPGLKQHRVKQPDLQHFSPDAVDLDPVAGANAILAHQHEPAKEPNDEIFHGHRQARPGEREDGRKVGGNPENNQQNQQHAEGLQHEQDQSAHRVHLEAFKSHAGKQTLDQLVGYQHEHADQNNPEHGQKDLVQKALGASIDKIGPAGIDG